MYMNIHSGDLVTVLRTIPLKDGNDLLTIYVLSNGERWEANLFYKNWKLA